MFCRTIKIDYRKIAGTTGIMDLLRKYAGDSLSCRGAREESLTMGERISFFDQTKSSISSFGPARKKEARERIHISSGRSGGPSVIIFLSSSQLTSSEISSPGPSQLFISFFFSKISGYARDRKDLRGPSNLL